MKITILKKEQNKKIKIILPLFMLKSKFILNAINENIDYSNNKVLFNDIYISLKKYIKKYGHFNLVEVKTSDNVIVKIRI